MHRFAGVSRRGLAREVGITCASGLYSAPFLRGESVIPCAKGRYPLRERSVSFARKVGIPCAEGLYFRGPHRRFLRERSVFLW